MEAAVAFGSSARSSRALLLLAAVLGLCLVQCAPTTDGQQGLLAGLQPTKVRRVSNPQHLNDGVALRDGRPWRYRPSARFDSKRSVVEYDLGGNRTIRAGWILADHNDAYEIEVSADGKTYERLWTVAEASGGGFRARFASDLQGSGRYIRIRPVKGDKRYAVSELRLFSEPLAEPPAVPRVSGYAPGRTFRSKVMLFGLALVGWLLLSLSWTRWWWVFATAAWPLVAGFQVLHSLLEQWPVGSREVSLVRGTVAAVAAVAIGLEALTRRYRPKRAVVSAVLGVCAVVAFLGFYNLGRPQFYNHQLDAESFVHYFDLRQYYTTAKYFEEAGYSGIYAADVAAYLEDVPGASLERLADQPMRDLESLGVGTVADQREAIEGAPGRFTAARWAEYKRDTGYFREVVGHGPYLETLLDMGGNATPVWLGAMHVLFNVVAPSERAFLATALLDPLLILAALAAIGFVFGLRTMLVCMVIFGANDFIMYGTNWGGATLRHDWMAYLAFGACALKRERFALGGALFAASAMIRAFPALALVGTALPAIWWLLQFRLRQGSFPSVQTIQTEQRPLLRIIVGAAIGVAVLFAFSVAVLPADAWLTWIKKVGQLSSGTQANHVSLRLLVAGWESGYWTMLERIPIFVAAILAMVALVFVAARDVTPAQAAMLGLVLIPVVFYPANYYSHFVWLLPMLAIERRGVERPVRPAHALIWMTLLFMCAVQYFTVLAPNLPLHFWLSSAVLLATLPSILILFIRGQETPESSG